MFEIERKFLTLMSAADIKREFSEEFIHETQITQWYLEQTGDWVVRLRREDDVYFLTMKKKVNELRCIELETEISNRDAESWLPHFPEIGLSKRRYLFCHNGYEWSIDEFTNRELSDLRLAEIELNQEGEDFCRPPWLGEEVTSDPRYRNFQLIKEIS